VLTSDTTATGAGLLCWLRAHWRIENMFKYAAQHNGIDAVADYRMDIGPDIRKVQPGPGRRPQTGRYEVPYLDSCQYARVALFVDSRADAREKRCCAP